MQMVKESLNEGYCDISGHPTDMIMAGEMGGIKVYVAKGVSWMCSKRTQEMTILNLVKMFRMPGR